MRFFTRLSTSREGTTSGRRSSSSARAPQVGATSFLRDTRTDVFALAHDIAADYVEHGVDVTLFQRSETYIMSTKEGMPRVFGGMSFSLPLFSLGVL